MSAFNVPHSGLTFERLQMALTMIFFADGEWDDSSVEFKEAMKKVQPMQHNFMLPYGNPTVESPYNNDSDMIQFWIVSDDRLVHNKIWMDLSSVDRLANITIRFLGKNAELFSKSFGHMQERTKAWEIFAFYTNGGVLDYIGPTIPQNIHIADTGDNFIAYSIDIMLRYKDTIKITDQGIGILKYLVVSD